LDETGLDDPDVKRRAWKRAATTIEKRSRKASSPSALPTQNVGKPEK
jgi:hypothetical protein